MRLHSAFSVALAAFIQLSLAQINCPTFPSPRPAPSSLTGQTTLPDPFQYFQSTRRVASPEEWYACRQPEIKRLLQEYQFGFYPNTSAETVTASRSGNSLTVTVSAGGKSGQVRASLALPSGASASNPVPVMIAIGGVDNNAYTRAGIAVATLDYGGVAPDSNGKTGAFWSLYNGQDIGVLTAWAWGVHRTLDGIVQVVPEIDPKRTAATGCSRLGKAALAAGLFDDRILVTVPMSSGIQGLGPYRYWQLSGQGENLENSKQGAPWWTCSVISGFLNNHERLPYDSHFIAAAIAPRYVVVDEGQSDPYVNARGTATIVYPAVREVFKWLGVADRIGMAIRSGGHCDMSGHANVMPFLQKVFSNTTTTRDYNNLAPWSATSSAFPWATNIPTATGPVVIPTSNPTTTTASTSTTTSTSASTTAPTATPTFGPCSPKYGQCGGTGYTGATCCASGSTCVQLNDWYSQCS